MKTPTVAPVIGKIDHTNGAGPVVVSNLELLEALFADIPHDAAAMLCGFPGDPNDESGDRRRKDQFCRLHAVMIDDVGTKVAPGRLRFSPSARIETSPGELPGLPVYRNDAGGRQCGHRRAPPRAAQSEAA